MSESGGSGLWQMLAPWTSADPMNRWFERTAWWTRPQAFTSQRQMLIELLEAVAGRFLGRQLTLDVRGRRVAFTLGQVRVESDERDVVLNPMLWWTETPAAQGLLRLTRTLAGQPASEDALESTRVRVDASELTIDDRVVGDVAATVDGVHFEFGTTSELVTGPLDLDVCATRATALEWANAALPDWKLWPRAEGLVAATRRHGRLTLLGRPEVVDTHAVRVEVVGIEVVGRAIRLPRWLIRDRTFSLPAASAELELWGLQLDGDVVRMRLRHPGVRQPVRPEHVRAAIRDGITSFGAAVFGNS